MDGLIFDIQRFSIHDGPGIRTTVFFKGCNLRCKWCHNPESQSPATELMRHLSKCKGCGNCDKFCGKAFTESCTECGKCLAVCKHDALELVGKRVTVGEVMDTVIRDKLFYETSGGGVTISGGEPLLQAEFVAELLQKLQSAGIHTALETAGNVPYDVIERVLPYLDLFLYDIKAIDEKTHIACTGVSNLRILSNAEKLKKSGVPVRFRMPVVPGFNMHEAQAVADFVGDYPLELLAYHEIGKSKYAALQRQGEFISATVPTEQEMTALATLVGGEYYPTGL